MAQRPFGVTILAVLSGLAGILFLLGALVLGVSSAYLTTFIEQYSGLLLPAVVLGAVLTILAVIAEVIGILYLVLAYGMWIGAGWAWILAIILLILDIIGGILSLPGGIVAIIIAALILWYFMQPHMKAFFGKGAPPSPPPAPPA
jgi:hypothetical protein